MGNAPCKDCPDRAEGCHGRCEKYQSFYRQRQEEREHEHLIRSSMRGDKRWFREKFRKDLKYGR